MILKPDPRDPGDDLPNAAMARKLAGLKRFVYRDGVEMKIREFDDRAAYGQICEMLGDAAPDGRYLSWQATGGVQVWFRHDGTVEDERPQSLVLDAPNELMPSYILRGPIVICGRTFDNQVVGLASQEIDWVVNNIIATDPRIKKEQAP